MSRLKKPIAVVGCGHSGTFYASEVFQALGLDIRHEVVGRDGLAGWNYTHLVREQFVEHGLAEDAIVLHQVRHPLNVISSLQAMEDDTWITVGERAKARGFKWNPLNDPHPVRGMKYWLTLNAFAEQIAIYRYRVEDMGYALPAILKILGVKNTPMPDVPSTMNKHEYDHIFTWPELHKASKFLYNCTLLLSANYGYLT